MSLAVFIKLTSGIYYDLFELQERQIGNPEMSSVIYDKAREKNEGNDAGVLLVLPHGGTNG